MKVFVGLGNPGKQYLKTPHNAGFLAVEELAKLFGINEQFKANSKFNALTVETNYKGEKLVFLKPLSFMNLSGGVVKQALLYYKADSENLQVFHDDIDLELGVVRSKVGGGNGGHNGLKSISEVLKTPDFLRFRIGVGRGLGKPGDKTAGDYVLKNLSGSSLEELNQVCFDAAKMCYNNYNG